ALDKTTFHSCRCCGSFWDENILMAEEVGKAEEEEKTEVKAPRPRGRARKKARKTP
ncbi:hypothetical protein ATANTOWER_030291, partial [Ataeniobius toweri]|nr:hypothetical protein [Ataeniobius toweri]